MITTTKYALKIPQDDDSADLRIYVGDNMTILDGHKHDWADITTGKPTTFTPPLMRGDLVGGAMVGNGLGMSGNYLYVKTLTTDGTKINTTNNSIAIDRVTTDTWYASKIHAHDWADITTGKPTAFIPVPMSTTNIGGALVGNGLAMSVDNFLYIKTGTGLFIDTTNYSLAINRITVDTWYAPKIHSHDWADITTGKPTTFTPPIATAGQLGGIKVGTGLTVTVDGTLSTTTYTLPIATTGILGGVKIGNGISVTADGTISVTTPAINYSGWIVEVGGITENIASGNSLSFVGANGTTVGYNATTNTMTITGANAYILPKASPTVLGGIMVGTGLTIDATGILSATGTTYTLPKASPSVLGGIMVGTGLTVDTNGVLSVTGGGATTYTLPPATTTSLGGVIVGTGLNVDGTGLISVGTLNYLPLSGGTVTGAMQVTNQLNINAINNSLVQTQPIANTVWYGIMKDATSYSYAMGRFTASSDNIDLRAYFGNLTLLTGRSATATTADITIQTNQSNVVGISQNIHLRPNTTVGTAGYVQVWSAFNVTGQITQNGGLNVIQQSPVAGTGAILNVWTGTQAQYDVLSKDPSTVYYIVG